MTRAMREVKDCLREATMSLVHSGFTNENDVFAVEQWLLMETAAFDASGSKRKPDNDSNNKSKGSKTNVNATPNLRLPRSPLQLPSVLQLQDISIGNHSLLRSLSLVEIPCKWHNVIPLMVVLANL